MFKPFTIPAAAACVGCLLSFNVMAADVHPAIKSALNWKMPIHGCGAKPRMTGAGIATVDESGTTRREDYDSHKLDRYKRKQKRWNKCITRYRKTLMKDFETLKGTAQHGLTQTQADIILGNMKTIQTTLIAEDHTPSK